VEVWHREQAEDVEAVFRIRLIAGAHFSLSFAETGELPERYLTPPNDLSGSGLASGRGTYFARIVPLALPPSRCAARSRRDVAGQITYERFVWLPARSHR
ncbi:hypothetical protein, partial [Caballeronia cordobensis]|uniref:hypothetical protein n=1 Tax=Caballeronia cordobensis TaxID=1353886 RepID=UPI001F1A6E0C